MIPLYLKIPKSFVRLIFLDLFWVMHIPFVPMTKFKRFAQLLAKMSRFYTYTLFVLIKCNRLLCHHIIYICYFVASCLFLLWHSPYGVVLCCYPKKFNFSPKFSLFLAMSTFSCVRFRLFVTWNIHTVFFLPLLYSGYFCSVDACVVCIVSGHWNQSPSVFFI